jgi:hypothetical protein
MGIYFQWKINKEEGFGQGVLIPSIALRGKVICDIDQAEPG